jgi:hypothetical protein
MKVTHIKCPVCTKKISVDAEKCPHCLEWVDQTKKAEQIDRQVKEYNKSVKGCFGCLGVFIAFFLFLVFVTPSPQNTQVNKTVVKEDRPITGRFFKTEYKKDVFIPENPIGQVPRFDLYEQNLLYEDVPELKKVTICLLFKNNNTLPPDMIYFALKEEIESLRNEHNPISATVWAFDRLKDIEIGQGYTVAMADWRKDTGQTSYNINIRGKLKKPSPGEFTIYDKYFDLVDLYTDENSNDNEIEDFVTKKLAKDYKITEAKVNQYFQNVSQWRWGEDTLQFSE